jgi:hypothetical protein
MVEAGRPRLLAEEIKRSDLYSVLPQSDRPRF